VTKTEKSFQSTPRPRQLWGWGWGWGSGQGHEQVAVRRSALRHELDEHMCTTTLSAPVDS
jgi:hypothetical protein